MGAPTRLAIGLAFVLACSSSPVPDDAGTDGGACAEPGWATVFASLDRSVLSVAGSSDSDVYLVGGGLGVTGRGALALHFDGTRWTEIGTGRSETLWWVFLSPAHSPAAPDVWMVGEQGLVLRWDGHAARVVPSGTGATLYGVWGATQDDVFIVGGTPGAGRVDGNDVLVHWDGRALTTDGTLPKKGATLYKIWGTSKDDFWISGELGTLWHRTPLGFVDASSSLMTTFNVLTVHGCAAGEVYAVAGSSVFAYDGSWRSVKSAPSGANGVACGAAGVLVVGNAGTKLRFDRAAGAWTDHRRDEPWQTDFHGAWVSPSGAMWAVGGNFLTPPSAGVRTGVVGFFGCNPPSSTL